MKSTFNWVYKTLMVVAGVVALAACSSKDTPVEVPKELPTFNDLSVMVGDEGTIDFSAAAVWTISSDKQWFALSPTTGVAGAQKVKYTVTSDGQDFDSESATVTFQMDGRQVTFKATRGAAKRELTLFTVENNTEWKETSLIELIYLANANNFAGTFAVRANFDWKLTCPEWISIEENDKSGDANPTEEKPAYRWARIDFSKATLEDMSGDLVFVDAKNAEEKFVKTITAPGSKMYMLSQAAPIVELNHEGKYTDSKTENVTDGYQFTVTAGTDDVTFFKVWKDNNYYGVDPTGMGAPLQYTAPWCGVDGTNNTTIGPAVKEFGYELWCQQNDDKAREATIVALPTAMAAGLTEKDLVADGDQELKPEYQQYIVTDLTQTVASGLSFAYGSMVHDITLNKMADGDESDAIKSEFGVKLVYELTYDSFASATSAEMKFSGYDSETLSVAYAPEEAELTDKSGWVNMEVAQNLMVVVSDEFVPFSKPRNALIVIKSKSMDGEESKIEPVLVLKVQQNCSRAE